MKMTIQVMGPGCARCATLEKNTKEAVAQLGIDATVEKITDRDRFMAMGVMMTPAIAINGEIKESGKVLSPSQVADIIKAAQ
jgi:small redox-active disulfide protein 2